LRIRIAEGRPLYFVIGHAAKGGVEFNQGSGSRCIGAVCCEAPRAASAADCCLACSAGKTHATKETTEMMVTKRRSMVSLRDRRRAMSVLHHHHTVNPKIAAFSWYPFM